MKTKYIEVAISDRLPDDSGWYNTSHGGFDFNAKKQEFQNHNGEYQDCVNYWLEEVPDREEEMRKLFEEILMSIDYNEILETTDYFKEKIEQLLNTK